MVALPSLVSSILMDIGIVRNMDFTMANEIQAFREINLYLWIPISLICIMIFVGILLFKANRHFSQWLSGGVDTVLSILGIGGRSGLDNEKLQKIIKTAGYVYDSKQDIFFSDMNAWQRDMGYCRLYDEAAASMGMIIDCEPIRFEFGGKRWLIELWKGQYDLTTGCEIGVYTTEGPDLDIPGVFNGTFYKSASNSDRLYLSCSLRKNGKILFKRKDRHWWLTGFKLGEFSEPWELSMNVSITLKDEIMCEAFIKGLKKTGYSENEFIINGNTVSFEFSKAHTRQPLTRTQKTDWLIQKKNELLCNKYQEITGPYNNLLDKINAIKKQSPELYKEIFKIGKPKQLFMIFEQINNYLD